MLSSSYWMRIQTSKFLLLSTCIALSSCNALDSSSPTTSTESSTSAPVQLALSPGFEYVPVGTNYQFTVVGGVPPYTYKVKEANLGSISASGMFTASSSTGIATVQVTDTLGDYRISSVMVNYPLALNPISNSIDSTQTKQLTATGGVVPYTYSVKSGSGSVSNSGLFSPLWVAADNILQVKDAFGNKADAMVRVLPSARQFGTVGSSDTATGITADSSGNAYVVGTTYTGLNGNSALGLSDGYLVKFDPAGKSLFTVQIGTSATDKAVGSAVDSNGNIYVVGMTAGSVPGYSNLGADDIFLAKYNSSGVQQFLIQFGTSLSDQAAGVALDSLGNVYITGHSQGVMDTGSNAGNFDVFVSKYNSSGVKQWAKQLGTAASDKASGIAIDVNNNIYVTGNTLAGLDSNSLSGTNAQDLFLIKYDTSGVKQWTRQFGGGSANVITTASGVAVAAGGSIYISGNTNGSLDGSPNRGNTDIFMVKYDHTGARLMVRQLGGAATEEAYGIAVDSSENIFLTGYTNGNLDLSNVSLLNQSFLLKYDSTGNQTFIKQFGSSTVANAPGTVAYGIGVGPVSSIFVVGREPASVGGFDGSDSTQVGPNLLLKFNSSGKRQ